MTDFMTRRNRAFTLVEVMVAVSMLMYASLAFYSLYVQTTKEAVHSQFFSLAALSADSLLEEVEGHRFGMPAPKSWGFNGKDFDWQELDYDIQIEGKKVETKFHVQWHMENTSFIGKSSEIKDVVTLVISWREDVGTNPDYGKFSKTFYKDDNRHLVVQVPVWE